MHRQRLVNVVNSECFFGDTGAVSTNKEVHLPWALAHSRDDIRNNLRTKVKTAFNCIQPSQIANLFGSISLQVANVRNVVPAAAIASVHY